MLALCKLRRLRPCGLGQKSNFWSHLGAFCQWGCGFTASLSTLKRNQWGRGWWVQAGQLQHHLCSSSQGGCGMATTGPLMQTLARWQRSMLVGGRCPRVKHVGVKIHCCKTRISMVQNRVSPWSCSASADVVSDHTVKAPCGSGEPPREKTILSQNCCRDLPIFWGTGSPVQACSSPCFPCSTLCPPS